MREISLVLGVCVGTVGLLQIKEWRALINKNEEDLTAYTKPESDA